MSPSRRTFLASAAAAGAVGTAAIGGTRRAAGRADLPRQVVDLFAKLPGRTAVKIWAPAAAGAAELVVSSNADRPLFCASAFKGFVLCEALRQADGPDVNRTLATTTLDLNESVWSLGSSVFNPPRLSGAVSVRTALEAMISHSDNTATDMVLGHVGPDAVRRFLADAGLRATRIPDSTRKLIGYVFGAADWRSVTWDEVNALLGGRPALASPVINDVQTMASTADDFVSFYSRALQGAFFKSPETLATFRSILSLADTIGRVIPLGANGFLKGGSLDAGSSHALSVAGGMYVARRWVYFATMINWEADVESDPATAAAFAASTKEAFALVAARLGA